MRFQLSGKSICWSDDRVSAVCLVCHPAYLHVLGLQHSFQRADCNDFNFVRFGVLGMGSFNIAIWRNGLEVYPCYDNIGSRFEDASSFILDIIGHE